MKKNLSIASLVLFLSISFAPSAHASAIIGAIEPTQILNNLELIPINISDTANAMNTTLMRIKSTVLDPLADSLIVITQLNTANGIITLVNGGFQGNSLIAADPRKYVDQKGLEVVKISLGALASQEGGVYTQSLLNSLTINFRSSSLTNQVQAINQSALPSIVQKKACDDTMLSNLAQEDVAVEGQPLDQAAYTERKQYFYEQFCAGDPTNPATAKSLAALNKARPELGGWDSWLDVTGGDNASVRAMRTNLAVGQEVDIAKENATKDLDRGRGVASQKECLLRATKDIDNEPYVDPSSAPCISDVVLNPSGLLQDSLTKATSAGLDRLANIQGWGSLIQTLASIKQLSDGVRSVTGSMSATLDSTAGGSSGGGTGNTSNSSVVTSAPVNDLTNDPEKKKTIVDPIEKLLAMDTQTLNDLRAVDQSILADLLVYEQRLNEAKDCYADVDPQNGAALALFAHRTGIINDLRAKIASDMPSIATAEANISSARATLQTSQSTKQIMDVFFAYQDKAESRPSYMTLAARKADYTQNTSRATADKSPSGELTRLYNTCVNMRAVRDLNP